jgi:hypothetical protein
LVLVTLATISLTAGSPGQVLPLPAAEAVQFVGKVGSFEGLVAGVRVGPRGAVILDLDRKAPRAALSILVPAGTAEQVPDVKKWAGKRVIVKGLVQRIDGRLQITIDRAADLTVSEQPNRVPCDDSPGAW